MKTNHIGVVFTGGTIGSRAQNGTVNLDVRRSASRLIEDYKKTDSKDTVFTEYRPVDFLSENIRSDDLKKIAACIRSIDKTDTDGIVLTHGTDTLCFTANYLSQVFCDLEIPLVLVGALYPLSDPRSNGADNFSGAVDFIRSGYASGVFAAFKNPSASDCEIHFASRLTDADPFSGAFHSYGGVPFGVVRGGQFAATAHPNNPAPTTIKSRPCSPAISGGIDSRIVVIDAHALLDFSLYRFETAKPHAVIVRLYHSGTVCTKGADTSFDRFSAYCTGLGIPVILAPAALNAPIYDGVKSLREKCVFAYDMSFEAATVKVMIALANGIPPETFLNAERFFEKVHA